MGHGEHDISAFEKRRLVTELIAEAEVDEVAVWMFVVPLREEFKIPTGGQMKSICLELVQMMLEWSDVVAGEYLPQTYEFVPWDLTADEVVARISREWDQLGRDPSIGELGVFLSRRLANDWNERGRHLARVAVAKQRDR